MNALQYAVWKLEQRNMIQEGDDRQLADAVFQEHKDRLIATYCAMMRLHYEIDRRNEAFPKDKPFPHPTGSESREFCNAAVHILVVSDPSLQRYFLNASVEEKTKLVDAVLKDGGILRSDGYFSELPV